MTGTSGIQLGSSAAHCGSGVNLGGSTSGYGSGSSSSPCVSHPPLGLVDKSGHALLMVMAEVCVRSLAFLGYVGSPEANTETRPS